MRVLHNSFFPKIVSYFKSHHEAKLKDLKDSLLTLKNDILDFFILPNPQIER